MANGNFGVFEKFLDLATEGQTQNANRLRTYSVPGYPIFYSWGILSAIEIDQEKGTKKAHFLLPNLSVPAVSLDTQPASHPCGIYLTDLEYPQNLKLKIPNHINSTLLQEGHPYLIIAAIKAAAVGGGGRGGGNAVGYFDGYLCGFFEGNPSDWQHLSKMLEDYLKAFPMLEIESPKRRTPPTAPASVPTAAVTSVPPK